MCDLAVGDKVQLIGPFGASFLMPDHPHSNIAMIFTGTGTGTGTGSAPMRSMAEWRRRLRLSCKFEGGKLMLFFIARTISMLINETADTVRQHVCSEAGADAAVKLSVN